MFTVHHWHHPGEAPCQNRGQVTEQILNEWEICVNITSKGPNLSFPTLDDLYDDSIKSNDGS